MNTGVFVRLFCLGLLFGADLVHAREENAPDFTRADFLYTPFLQEYTASSSIANLDKLPEPIAVCYKYFNGFHLSTNERQLLNQHGLVRDLLSKNNPRAMIFGAYMVAINNEWSQDDGEDAGFAEYVLVQRLIGYFLQVGRLLRMPRAKELHKEYMSVILAPVEQEDFRVRERFRCLREILYWETGCVINPVSILFGSPGQEAFSATSPSSSLRLCIARPSLKEECEFISTMVLAMQEWYFMLECVACYKGITRATDEQLWSVQRMLRLYPKEQLSRPARRLHDFYEQMIYSAITKDNLVIVLNCLLKPLLYQAQYATRELLAVKSALQEEQRFKLLEQESLLCTRGLGFMALMQQVYNWMPANGQLDEMLMSFFEGNITRKLLAIDALSAAVRTDIWAGARAKMS